MLYKQTFDNQEYKKLYFFKLLKVNKLGFFVKKKFLNKKTLFAIFINKTHFFIFFCYLE